MNTHTPYEREQLLAIAEWKADSPGVVSNALGKAAAPAVSLVQKFVPDVAIRGALGSANWLAEKLADTKDIKRRGGVEHVTQLREGSLEACDALANRVHNWSVALAVGEGGGTGAAGALGLAADLPLIVTLSLRTIHKIGLCYGYECSDASDRKFILGVLAASGANSAEEKAAALEMLRAGQLDEGISMQSLAKQLGVNLARRKVLQSIPLVGAGVGAGVNGWLIREVGWAARRAFQERWLADRDGHVAQA